MAKGTPPMKAPALHKPLLHAVIAIFSLSLFAGLSFAHTSVATTTPKSGAVLAQSPPVIEIQFRDEVRMTSVVVLDVNKVERRLEFAPKSSAAAFKLENAELRPGRNEIQWKALSKDGHVVSGSLIITIAPAG
jgi:methionine-rich copper-binding protein CopC